MDGGISRTEAHAISREPKAGDSDEARVGPTDSALVLAARAGQAWAQEALFRRYARLANGLAFRMLGGDPDVEDLVQDAFAYALSGLDKLQDPGAFKGWLASIVVRQAGKRLRRRKLLVRLGMRRNEPHDIDACIGEGAPPDVVAELKSVYRVMDSIPVDAHQAFILRHVEGWQLAEIAKELGVSLATAKRRLRTAEEAAEQARERVTKGGNP
jgi:RNA polymerase sigma-70 factor (ECF subfamily)